MVNGAGVEPAFAGTNLWLLLPALEFANRSSGFRQAKPLEGGQYTFVRFDPRWEIPATIPLPIEADAPAGFPALRVRDDAMVAAGLGFTSQGLRLLKEHRFHNGAVPGFAFIPHADIDAWLRTHQPESL